MTDTPLDTNDAAAPQQPQSWKRKGLSIGFNVASGFAVAALLAKFGVVSTLLAMATPVAAPAIVVTVATIVLTGILTGAATSVLSFAFERAVASPDERDSVRLTLSGVAKRMAMSAVGGALFFGLDALIDGVGGFFAASADVPVADVPDMQPVAGPEDIVTELQPEPQPDDVVADIEPAAGDDVVAADPDCVDHVAKAAEILAAETDLTPCAEEALRLAQAGNAQAMKDLGLFFLSGYEGVPVNTEMAVDLLKQAATGGNQQAMVDLAYLEFHGKAGFDANPGEALKAMMEVNTTAAREFIAQWTAMGIEVPAETAAVVEPVVAEPAVVESIVAETPVVAEPVAEAVVEMAVDPDCVDHVAKAAEILATDTDLTPCAEEALKRAQAGSAQGLKDIGMMFLNGLEGVPKDPALGVELLKQAADAGNVQARIDMAYLQYHGLHGVEGGKDEAIALLRDINTGSARDMLATWTGVSAGDITMDISADADGNMVVDINVGQGKVLSQMCDFTVAANGTGTLDCDIETTHGTKHVQAVIEDCHTLFPNMMPR